MSRARSWEYDSGQHLRVDVDADRVIFEDFRPGNEGCGEQTVRAFTEAGPGSHRLPRAVTLEVLAFLGVSATPWCDPRAVVHISVGGRPLVLHAYPRPEPYERGLDSEIARFSLSTEAYFAKYPLGSGVLAEDQAVDGLVLARDTLALFYPSGSLRFGTLAEAATVDGLACPAGARISFDEP